MLVLNFITTTKVLPNFWIHYIIIMLCIILLALVFRVVLAKKYKFKTSKKYVASIIILAITITIFYTFSQLRLNLNINENYIEYKLNPLQPKLSIINKNDIKKIYADDIINYNKPSLGGDINSYNCILGGKSVLIIQTNKDEYIRLSTNINKFELDNILSNYQYIKNQ
ncbi:MAG: hypothetical protein ACQPRJ_05325 [Solitalea-like symbiont of Acarus siro]